MDASVAVKWVVPEEHTDRAQQLWVDALATNRRVVVPPHFSGEVANAIYQRLRTTDPTKHLDLPEAESALTHVLAYPLQMLTPPDLYRHAFAFARRYGLPSMYDSLYVVCTQFVGVDLWTADRRLLAALGPSAPWVRFIGDYPP